VTHRIRNLTAAREEFAAAVLWYEQQRPGLGGEFFDAIVESTSLIQNNPESGTPSYNRQARRVVRWGSPTKSFIESWPTRSLSSQWHTRSAGQVIGKAECSLSLVRPTDCGSPAAATPFQFKRIPWPPSGAATCYAVPHTRPRPNDSAS